MNPADEKKLRVNWSFLKQELQVDGLVDRFLQLGLFTQEQRNEILAASASLVNKKGDKFLEAVLAGGNKAYQTLCNIILEKRSVRNYQSLIKVLEIEPPDDADNGMVPMDASRQSTTVSMESGASSSMSLRLGDATSTQNDSNGRMVSARAPWRAEFTPNENTNVNSEQIHPTENQRPQTPAQAVHRAVEMASDSKTGAVDMESLENELIKIAPTIADLFNKIQKQTSTVVAASEEELIKIREDNDRLRKTNRTLVEKLNSFQQKIIQLQLENKKLREVSDNEKMRQIQLDQKSSELELLKEKLQEQKKALELKEIELDHQMEKINNVIRDNEEQKMKLATLEQLHEEGKREFEDQQQQISELVQEKEQQREQIQALEEKQRLSEQLLYRFEERLLQLERPRKTNNGRSRFGLSRPWMNGAVERSHHANVKLQPQFPTDWSTNVKGGKGWSF